MAWIYLIVASVLEIGWAAGLKSTQGFTRPGASFLTIIAMVVSGFFFAQAVRTLPLGTAYAIWTGIGTVGTVLLGVGLFGDTFSLARAGCVIAIVAGILGLKLLA